MAVGTFGAGTIAARGAAQRVVWPLGALALATFLVLLVSVVVSGPPVTWLAALVYVICGALFAIASARRYPFVPFILPALSLYLLFVLFPTFEAFRVSLYQWSGYGEPTDFVGLANFVSVLTSFTFYRAALHNAILFVSIFILQNTIGLALAVALHSKPRFFEVYRAAIFLPGIISLVATGLIWQVIFGSNIGLLTPVLQALHLDFLVRDWLGDDTLTFWLLVLVQFWQWMGLPMVIYLAGLQNVPDDLVSAAKIDGASDVQAFRYVTFPLLAPAFTVVTGLSFITMFRVFDIPFVMAGSSGAPDGTTDVLGLVLYRDAFGLGTTVQTSLQQGYAVAIGVVMFVALLAATTFQLAILRRREVDL